MTILLVEDDPNKAARVTEELAKAAPEASIDRSRSFKSALRLLMRTAYDFVVIDMTLPMFDADNSDPSGYRVEHFGGKLLLNEMYTRNLLYPTMVLTQFDILGPPEERMTLTKLDAELHKKFDEFYLGAVFYKSSEQSWRIQLGEKITKIRNINS